MTMLKVNGNFYHRDTETQRTAAQSRTGEPLAITPILTYSSTARLSVRFSLCLCASVVIMLFAVRSYAHDDDKKRPPTKAKADLAAARVQMDAAKKKLMELGRYSCCVKAPPDSKAPGCDLCAKEHGSCNCGANLAAGKGVCGDCLAGWKSGRGAFPGIKKDQVTLLDASHQAMPGMDMKDAPPELAQARNTLNKAKKTLVQEGRYSCCVGQGGCDECAYEASCPCAKELAKGQKGKGICGQCYDGQHAGHGRIQGATFADAKLSPMQHGMEGMGGMFAGIPEVREASGTAWQPDSTPMRGQHTALGPWMLMTHYNSFLSYDNQSGPRGDSQINSTNWFMLMARRPVGKDELTLRGMLSLEPATTSPRGYPLLFQSGEAYGGNPLVDRQHPHDLFMEVAARYRHFVDDKTAISLYVAPSGEPALGPVAYPHRLSAMDIPFAPIGHHWEDSTHIAFGVLTGAVSRGNTQVEGSIFTGREPDEHRWNFDTMKLDSYSGRLTYNPGPNWSLQGSYGYIKSPESLRPGEDVRRATFSASYNQPRADGGNWASTFVFGRNREGGADSDALLLETDLNFANRNILFGRLEHVDKLGSDLALLPAGRKFGITQLSLGGVHELTPGRSYETGVGAAVTFNWKPSDLDAAYGKNPMGFWLFLRIRPAPMHHEGHGEMAGGSMKMPK
jgi:hypothetical protein